MSRAALIARAEQQHGLVSRRQVLDALGSSSAVYKLFRSSGWEPVTPRVLRRIGVPRTDGQRALAVVLDAPGDAVLSHFSAASWWGLTGCSLTPLTIATASDDRRRTELGVTHRVSQLPKRWVATHEGVPIVRPEFLALQLCAICSEQRAGRLVDHLWSERLLSGATINRFLDDLGERGRNGTAGLRRYLKPRGVDYTPPASGLESRVMELLNDADIPVRPQVNSGGEQWTGRVDFRHEISPLIVEVQSEKYHASLTNKADDERRIEALEADGFTVVEVTDADVWQRPGYVVEKVRVAARSMRGISPARARFLS